MDVPEILSYQGLRARGLTRHDIVKLVDQGILLRLHQGIYTTTTYASDATIAIQNGARLGCLSGCRIHGLWVPRGPDTHIVYGTGKKPRQRPRTQIHRYGVPLPVAAVWPLRQCIEQVLLNHDHETALIILESAINRRLLRHSEAIEMLTNMPRKVQRIAPYVNGRAMSGSETRLRYFFERRGIRVAAQVLIPDVGWVDTVVGDSLIVECDSDAYHSSRESYANDRRRDLAARDQGYEPLRLSYQQIWHEWEATQLSLLRMIRAGKHRKP
ncbi:hypothetical protein DD236_06865 [Ancrocorticia populi]|uniref:AbiEi antitoxin N-terminal domain-containing protein n=1 Tax=Ancrocorticia populi TaxID=2175228 RepID=A0A2V1KB37_9ACTO|nr:hypothetical protein DD236_06865 [Ancrocorticia populi]